MSKRMVSLWLAVLALCLLAGCGGTLTEEPGRVWEYDLGQATLEDGREVPYVLQGVVGVPEGENRPVAVIVHGSHAIETAATSRYDLGFTYLVQDLAEAGYLAIAINVNMNYSFENGEPNGNVRTRQIVQRQLELLARAMDGEPLFPTDLTGKGDLSKTVLIGHSRGGFDILEISSQLEEVTVRGLLGVAPAEYKVLETEIPNVPVAFLLPQLDNDVIGMDAARLYETARTTPGRTAPVELIYLNSADHSGFNQALTEPDLNASEESQKLVMPKERQRAFLSAYAQSFVRLATEQGETVLSQAETLPSTLLGESVVPSVDTLGASVVLHAGNAPSYSAAGMEVEVVNAGYRPQVFTAGTFRIPGAFDDLPLLRLHWTESGAAFTILCDKSAADSASLVLEWAVDSSDARNRESTQQIALTLTDASGAAAEYQLPPDTAALLWQEGQLIQQQDYLGNPVLEYSTFTPLATTRIPLSAFDGVDGNMLEHITLRPLTDSGSVMLRSIRLEDNKD